MDSPQVLAVFLSEYYCSNTKCTPMTSWFLITTSRVVQDNVLWTSFAGKHPPSNDTAIITDDGSKYMPHVETITVGPFVEWLSQQHK
jgi:hypothetical protein